MPSLRRKNRPKPLSRTNLRTMLIFFRETLMGTYEKRLLNIHADLVLVDLTSSLCEKQLYCTDDSGYII